MKTVFRIVLAVGLAACLFGCGKDDGGGKEVLTVFHAGSLSVPFREISELFEKENPGIKVLAESAGSRHCARKMTELGRQCDVMGSADHKVVSNLLMPEYADFNIHFALNEMVVAFSGSSVMGEKINAENWYEILLDDEVSVGRSDPDSDPCGYRSLMVFQLAEKFYGVEGLYERLKGKDKFVRAKETDLLALLEGGEIDYAMIYLSVAVQHGLKYVCLPDDVNLKNSQMAGVYRGAEVKVSGKKPGEYITRTGEAMVYSVTIPKDAANRKGAVLWLELLLSDRGRAIMERNGQPVITPAVVDGFENLPESLKKYCRANERD